MNTIALIIVYASLGCCVSLEISLLGYGVWTTWQTRRRTRRVLRFVMEQIAAYEAGRAHANERGYITESRFVLYADSEAEVIAKLLGEQERP